MSFTQSIDLALASQVGGHGLPATAIEAALSAVGTAVERLREDQDKGTLPLLRLPATTDDLESIRATGRRLRDGATDIVILGVGGSSLGAQALAQLADYLVPGLGRLGDGPRIHFFDNLDPLTYAAVLERLPLGTTRFFAVSKSGGTGETLMQVIAVLTALDRAGLRDRAKDIIFGLSEPQKDGKRNALRDLLAPEGVSFLAHDPNVGGRYSVLSNVGLVPAAALDIDVAAIRAGAAKALAPFGDDTELKDNPAAVGAALNVAATLEGKGIAVVMAYADRLERFMKWWVQLWAESLGKDGKGTQPVGALGPVDQHSQQQLYLAGPKDKLFTVITTDVAGKGSVMDEALSKRAGEPGFAHKHIGDFVAAQGLAMIDTFAKNGCPVRRIHVPKLDETAMGQLLMHFMLETILTGYALGLDPFDQPAVEEAKILAKKYLTEGKG
ncbi:glucose-6-phosphate isomerase [Chelatococcus asaccharovorans]|uniref:Glucose-6-phosphate isomerase n=1 Tax=Chelatococcus asaccharovorans TaxID=28210 RepID=A0A2V3U247_9HYPH|nr:glucose-6-phosphate isomerase [Chelatococcus asaccharovorans]MBS7702235.1 glucose-6-phosphate isomerase [Chelatococcus asaccharovorans]PXW56566.1 glucose-6-phosphate isomerase [Chelatococcus asaccharovorans]